MITVQLGGSPSRALADASEGWISEQFRQRRRDGAPICIRVEVTTVGVNVALTSRDCVGGAGGGRLPNEYERKILDLWNRHVNDRPDVNPGHLIAFLHQLAQLV